MTRLTMTARHPISSEEDYPYSFRGIQYTPLSWKSYEEFLEANPKIKLSRIQYLTVMRVYGFAIAKDIIETGIPYSGHSSVPEISITKYQPKLYKLKDGTIKLRKSVDWRMSKLMGKKVYRTNSHTDGYILKFDIQNIETGNMFLRRYWTLKACRKANRHLAARLQSDDRHTLLGNYREIIKYKDDL